MRHSRMPYGVSSQSVTSCDSLLDEMSYKNVSYWQAILKWIVVIGFIALVSDWSFIEQRRMEELERVQFFESPAGQALIGEITNTIEVISQKGSDGTLTVREAALAQWKILEIADKTGRSVNQEVGFIYQCVEDSYIRNWQPPKEALDTPERRAYFEKMSADRREFMALTDFGLEFTQLHEETRPASFPIVGGREIAWGFVWLLKWYVWLMIPSFVVILINYYFSGYRLKEELLLNWQGIILRVIFWPIGANTELGQPSLTRKYSELVWMYEYDYDRRLTSEERDALWLKAAEPVLQFEDALSRVRLAGKSAKRPLYVCVLAWVMSMTIHPRYGINNLGVVTQIVNSLNIGGDTPDEKKGGEQYSSGIAVIFIPEFFSWALGVVEPEIMWLGRCRELVLVPYKPRGPPTVRISEDMSLFFWLSQQSRRRSS